MGTLSRRRTSLFVIVLIALLLIDCLPVDNRYRIQHMSNPERTVVKDRDGNWLATFTDHAYTVTLSGPERIFNEPTTEDSVISTTWVRVLPSPFNGTVDLRWLENALQNTDPDVLAIAMQYRAGALAIHDPSGLQIAGESQYGPQTGSGSRKEGADFYEYLGIPWKFSDRLRNPDPNFYHSLDCSGFMRIVWGYRSGLPLGYRANNSNGSIPRFSWEIFSSAPGVVLIPNGGDQVNDFSQLAPGDLVFFDARSNNPRIDHVGLYLGQDTSGHYRFISSRKTINGPTLGDVGGKSVLDGSGLYAKSFRAARRL